MTKYAQRLTKEDLMKDGIKDIYYNPDEERYHIIGNDGEEIKIYTDRQGYLYWPLCNLDKNGNKIKIPAKKKYKYKGSVKEVDSYSYKSRPMRLHRCAYAWFYGEVPDGLVVDHINNKHTTHYDNRLDNLQLITQKENSTKNRPKGPRNGANDLPCAMTKPIQYYIDKCNYWLMEYQREKEERGSQTSYAGSCRKAYSDYKRKIRYWYKHKAEWEEYNRLETAKAKARESQQQRLSKIAQFKEEIRKAKKIDKTLWMQKLTEYSEFLEANPFRTQEELEKLYLSELNCN